MRKTVVYDADGNIVALGPAPTGWPEGPTATPPKPIPGQTVAFIEVPEAYADQSHHELHRQLRVDSTSEEPKLVPKDEA